jgi:Ca2+-binding RTX toxin-like protein
MRGRARGRTPRAIYLFAVTTALCALMAAPSTALGSQVSHQPASDTVSLSASLGEANVVTVVAAAGTACTGIGVSDPCIVITDAVGVTAAALPSDCVATPTTTVTCPATSVTTIDLDLGGGDNQVTASVALTLLVRCGPGNDVVAGGPGDDSVRGQDGADTLDGGGGKDHIYGGDVLDTTSDGGNILRGGPGNDVIEAADSGDQADGGPDNDSIVGAAGIDQLAGGEGDDVVSGGNGNDVVFGGGGNDQIGAVEPQSIFAASRERGSDTFDGGPGDDLLRAGAGPSAGIADSDSLIGGEGTDTVDYGDRSVSLTVSLDGSGDDGAPGEGDNVAATVEGVVSGSGDDKIIGSAGPEIFEGGEGDDTLTGAGGTDKLTGSGGDDDLLGGGGADTLDGGEGEDYVDGGAGRDTMLGGGASDTLAARDGAADAVTSCGARTDFAISDRKDKLSGCDRVDKNPQDRPVLGSKIALRPVKGNLELRLPGTGRFVPLHDQADVPVGARVDASGASDRIKVTTTDAGGAKSSRKAKRRHASKTKHHAIFSRGAFSVFQRKSRDPVTDIWLLGGAFGSCKASRQAHAPTNRHPIRELFGKAKGPFKTHGRYGTAGVKGTSWLTQDSCDGTLIKVKSGIVVVSDLVKHRNVKVKKGRSYLARAP